MIIKLLTEHHLAFLSLKGGCIGSSESTLVKMPHHWKSHVRGHILNDNALINKSAFGFIIHFLNYNAFIYKSAFGFIIHVLNDNA